jgi:NodT family efflux transporter outer membrane factor (OMF) lipoprotein
MKVLRSRGGGAGAQVVIGVRSSGTASRGERPVERAGIYRESGIGVRLHARDLPPAGAGAACDCAPFQGRRRSSLSHPLVGVLAVAAALTGCAVGPNFRTPDPPPVANYLPGGDRSLGRRFVRGGDVPAQWWELFRSRYLNQLIEEGIIHNADLQAAEAAVRAAQANALAQRGTLFPVITGDFNSSRQKMPTAALTTNSPTGSDTFSLHTAQLSVSYVVDVFGGARRQLETTEAQAEAQAFLREGVYLTLTTNIALAAIQEASLRGQIAATRRLIDIATQLLGLLRRQYDLGQIALTDVVAQETAVAQAKLLLPPLEKALAQQRDLLAILTGRFPSEDIAATFRLGSFRMPRTIPIGVPADLVRQRPDVRVAEANLRAANAQIGVAIANRLPKITLTGNVGSTAPALARLFSPGTGFWTVAGDAAQTVFDAGTLLYKQRQAEETFTQTTAQYRSVVLVAFQNVADTLRALEADSRAVSAAITAERSAARGIDLIRTQIEQGQASLPVLIPAQQAFLQTSLARVQAEALRLADAVALFQALGGGWWNRPPPVFPAKDLRP